MSAPETPEDVAREIVLEWCANWMRYGVTDIERVDLANLIASALRARDERAARIVEGDIVEERYREWPGWGTGNRSFDSEFVSLTAALAAAIRARS